VALPGDEIPSLRRRSEPAAWNRFAAVNDEFVDIHTDDEAGRRAGFPSAFGMGNLQLAYLHAMLRGWLGEEGRILELSCRYRRPSLRGTDVIARGVVRSVTGEGTIIELEIWTEDGDGVRLSEGTARVEAPADA
jgi:acyl dehydratase